MAVTQSGPLFIQFPTLEPECHDTEARSLKKLNALMEDVLTTLDQMAQPGGDDVAPTTFVRGNLYTVPVGSNLLDLACYNPTDNDCWVYIMITPSAPIPGMPPTFPIRVYAHNHAYYEAMMMYTPTVPSGSILSIAVSATEQTLTWNANPVYLAIRHT